MMSLSEVMSTLRGARRKNLTASTAAATQTVTGSHVFRIEGYTKVRMTVPAGTAIKSTTFHVAGHDWRIVCLPNGESKDMSLFSAKNKYMSLFLENLGGSGNFTGEFDLSMVDCSGRPSWTHTAKLPPSKSDWGSKEFAKIDKLVLVDDCLTVLCDVTVYPVPEATDAA